MGIGNLKLLGQARGWSREELILCLFGDCLELEFFFFFNFLETLVIFLKAVNWLYKAHPTLCRVIWFSQSPLIYMVNYMVIVSLKIPSQQHLYWGLTKTRHHNLTVLAHKLDHHTKRMIQGVFHILVALSAAITDYCKVLETMRGRESLDGGSLLRSVRDKVE